jgi:hypothetical protein
MLSAAVHLETSTSVPDSSVPLVVTTENPIAVVPVTESPIVDENVVTIATESAVESPVTETRTKKKRKTVETEKKSKSTKTKKKSKTTETRKKEDTGVSTSIPSGTVVDIPSPSSSNDETRYCRNCDTTKPTTSFKKDQSRHGGFRRQCKACKKAIKVRNREKN